MGCLFVPANSLLEDPFHKTPNMVVMLEDIAQFAVEYAQTLGASYAEARVQRNVANSVVLKNGNPEVSGFARMRGMGIRVIVNRAMGFASTNLLNKTEVKTLVGTAVSTAKASAKTMRKGVAMAPTKATRDKWNVNPKKPLASVGVDEKLGILLEAEKALSPENVGVKLPARLLVIADEESEKVYVNSDGASITSSVPRVSFFYMLTALDPSLGTAQRFGQRGESRGWEAVAEWDIASRVAEEARTLGKVLREAQAPPRETVDVVLGSEVVGIVCHESCGHPTEADRILGREGAQAGESFITVEMLGKRLGNEAVTIVDDPTLRDSYGFYLYDDEGVKARRRELIKEGVLNELLHNRETAFELNVESNGSSRAVAYNMEPIIRMANTYMLPGDYDFEELVEDIKDGVFIKSFMEWNIDDRRYNQRYVGLESYRIQNGELKGLVRDPTLELTTPALYMSVDAVSKNLDFQAATCGKGDPMQGAPVWTGGPSIRLRSIRLGGVPP